MRNIYRYTLSFLTMAGLIAHAQSPSQFRPRERPKFEVASIKPCAPNTQTGTMAGTIGRGSIDFNCQPLMDYVRTAYASQLAGRGVGGTRIEGGPSWINKDLYRIVAKGDSSGKTTDVSLMIQTLLEDRFQLKVHWENREVPAYALVVAKGGIRLPAAKVNCYPADPNHPPPHPKPGEPQLPMCGRGQITRDGIKIHGSSMTDFCLALSNMPLRLDRRKFIDKTGVSGHFDFNFIFPDDSVLPAPPGATPMPPDDLSRLQNALRKVGLQLTGAKGTDEVLIVDHAERPSPN